MNNRNKTPLHARLTTILLGGLLALPVTAADQFTGQISFSSRPAVVAVLYVPGPGAQAQTPVVDQVDKQFAESLVVVAPGESVEFKNSDAVDHNIFANDIRKNARFDVGLMPPGGQQAIPADWNENTLVRVGCKIHPKMRMYIASLEARYHKVVEFDSRTREYPLSLAGVPADAETLVVRIPKYDVVELDLRGASAWTVPLTKGGKPRGEITLARATP